MGNPKGRPQKYEAKVQDRSTSIRLTPEVERYVKRKATEQGESVTAFILNVLTAWERADEQKRWENLSTKLCPACRPVVQEMLFLQDPETGEAIPRYGTPVLAGRGSGRKVSKAQAALAD